jgi:hypothetical protein
MGGMSANGATILAALLTGTGSWGLLQFFLDRRTRASNQAQTDATRQQILSEAQMAAQKAALESANERYQGLHADYISTREGLKNCRNATDQLIEAVDRLVGRMRFHNGDEVIMTMTSAEFLEMRAALRRARDHLS